VVLASARTFFFIGHIVGFSFINTIAEADWRSGSARHSVSFADQKPGPLNPFLSDNSVDEAESYDVGYKAGGSS
jgi:hypothetical protein